MIKKIIVILTLFISVVGFSQKNSTSAYSFFGIGDKNSSNTVEQLSMGGVGVAINDAFRLNLSNPASNSALQFTTYSLAIENKNVTVKDAGDSQKAATTYLSYLAMGIPVGEKGGFTFGLMPNTSVGYSLISREYNVDDTISEVSAYEGEGGTNKVFLSIGYRPFKGLSIGLQGNYIFGNIDNSIINQVQGVDLATKYETTSSINGFSLNAGFQYETVLNEKLNLYVGGDFDFENEIDSEGKEYLYTVGASSFSRPRDTLSNTNGVIKAPLKTTLGVGIGKRDKWYAGVDYSFQNAIELKGDAFDDYAKFSYDDYSKVALGGFYTPKYNSISSYWERVTYRAGVKFEKTGLLVKGSGVGTDFTAIDDFGISFGVGLPVSNQLSNLNLGFEFGKRGEATKDLVQENYINFRLSLSLSDKWFKKREIF